MKLLKLLLVAFSLANAAAEELDPAVAAHAMVENERKFFEMGQEQGTKAAFLKNLAEDSIVFHPGPINGQKEWQKRPEKGISLKWHPVFAAMSRSADLGYTTGPAEWRREKDDEKPFGYGQYITVWKKQKDGAWKVALDVGSEVPGPPKSEESEVEYSLSAALDPTSTETETAANRLLRNAEVRFSNIARTDSTAAILGSASDALRVQREGVYPAVGRDAAGLMLSVTRGEMSLEKVGGAMSDGGDLAYSYGKYTLNRGQKTEHGYYLHIWRLEKDVFKLWLDYQSPLPEEQKK